MSTTNEVYAVAEGYPDSGLWLTIGEFTDAEDVAAALIAEGQVPEDFHGAIEVAAADEPLATLFLRDDGTFDFDGCHEAAELAAYYPEEAIAAYVEETGDVQYFEDAYQGSFRSDEDFAEDLIEGICGIPDVLQGYIDWEKFANALLHSDYFTSHGYYFRHV